ncbi:flagellar basal body-associated FliL family protein [Stutzerimonas nitrititolerans]|uniref:flagellar basal body-associated FliL family protein n=1 Tax=Stutzerimonas nitrititolerans TaxID=2482751 RepID=UPI001482660A|nr:flagellar basal body-associated FliL family protein [Stutzerimonas nitrititolerans]MBT1120353.1 flagellar basal body-associated FliL family protein [Stutzerimonas nitrititolerans]NNT93853.1 flagellar basal body-associated FliL family protein [Stutzerimonas nitrititolerans]WAD25091.1 flagellar basal body-associated FliL family protein [Pseudomonadaceae bacterium T75]
MSTSRLVLLMLLLNVITVAGGVGVSYWLLKPGSATGVAEEARPAEPSHYEFFPVDKIIVSVRGEGREHYFVLDLVLQAEASDKPKDFTQAEPIVRNSVVAYLSSLAFNELRSMQIGELQQRLEVVLFEDFAIKNAVVPFKHVLVNKLLVQ